MATMKKLFLEQHLVPMDMMSADQTTQVQQRKIPWPHAYHVTKVVQSTEVQIGDVLTKGDVELFCKDDSWQVEIT